MSHDTHSTLWPAALTTAVDDGIKITDVDQLAHTAAIDKLCGHALPATLSRR